jgi:plasmid stability protein
MVRVAAILLAAAALCTGLVGVATAAGLASAAMLDPTLPGAWSLALTEGALVSVLFLAAAGGTAFAASCQPMACGLPSLMAKITMKPRKRTMASITIHNLDDGLKERLRVRAATHGRSMEAEARDILRLALTQEQPRGDLYSAVRDRFASLGGVELELPEREPLRDAPRYDG